MPEIINLEDEFNSWFNAVEVFGLRSERFFQEINYYRTREAQAELMITWLKAAYLHGIKTAARDSVDTLRDYSTSLADIDAYTYNPDEAYAACAVSLDVYWTDVLKDK